MKISNDFHVILIISTPDINTIKWKYAISTSNHMFQKAIWDKLPKCIFENFEIARVK